MAKAARDALQTKGEQTRRAILDAAIARFGREGYRATSVADIAARRRGRRHRRVRLLRRQGGAVPRRLGRGRGRRSSTRAYEAFDEPDLPDWRQTLLFTLVGAVERHPLARRLLAGLEPDVTDRVLEIPALTELRKACAERLRRGTDRRHGPRRHRPGRDRQRHRRHHALAADVGRAAGHRRGRALRQRRRRRVASCDRSQSALKNRSLTGPVAMTSVHGEGARSDQNRFEERTIAVDLEVDLIEGQPVRGQTAQLERVGLDGEVRVTWRVTR